LLNHTIVYEKNMDAYNSGYRIIANRGSSRSSKTFSVEQLIKQILEYGRRRVATTVSHSSPHLKGGAIRDFDRILEDSGYNVDEIRIKDPYIYTLGKRSILEFVGFDKPGKALGAARNILHINEAPEMPFSIVHHLMQRTTETIFMDWNPAIEFWFDTEGFEKRSDCIVIHSTFLDNYENLSPGQIQEFRIAQEKAENEDKKGKRGYWWNWWQVYGLGLQGRLEGIIFNNWQTYKELPDCDLFRLLVIDWGGNDPTTLTELHFDGALNRLYIKQILYQPQILNSKLIELVYEHNSQNSIVVYDSARKDKGYELKMAGIKAIGATKGAGSKIDNIELMQDFTIFIHEDSEDAISEFSKYRWAIDKTTEKPLNEPEDKNDHIIDPTGYGVRFYRRSIRPKRAG